MLHTGDGTHGRQNATRNTQHAAHGTGAHSHERQRADRHDKGAGVYRQAAARTLGSARSGSARPSTCRSNARLKMQRAPHLPRRDAAHTSKSAPGLGFPRNTCAPRVGGRTECARSRTFGETPASRAAGTSCARRRDQPPSAVARRAPAQSRRRCGRGEPRPGVDVAGVSPVPVQIWEG
jgi:hypothetical protein